VTKDRHVAVLIVGAGPTGLTLACDLARRKVSSGSSTRLPNTSQDRGVRICNPEAWKCSTIWA
jgi:flavin-dependent dehydrogenase